jgi:hypothetical protein
MKGKLHLIAGVLLVAMFLYDVFLWGGLARMPTLGPLMTDTTERELALAGLYLPLGARVVDATGLRAAAVGHAAAQFSAVESRLLARPEVAMETMLAEMPSSVKVAYYGVPLLLPLFAFLWWRRPRGVHMIGAR